MCSLREHIKPNTPCAGKERWYGQGSCGEIIFLVSQETRRVRWEQTACSEAQGADGLCTWSWVFLPLSRGFPDVAVVKNPPASAEDAEMQVRSLGLENTLGEEMATHSSILAWIIPWTEKPGGLQSMGSQRVRYNWAHATFQMCDFCEPQFLA